MGHEPMHLCTRRVVKMSNSKSSANVLSFSIVSLDSRRKKAVTRYYVADVLTKVASDVKKDTNGESLQLSEAYLRFFARETGLDFMDVVKEALSCGISITMGDPLLDLTAGTKKLTSEQEAMLIFVIRDKNSSKELKRWAEDILIQAHMDTAYYAVKKANVSGASSGTFDMDDLMQETFEAFLIGIRAANYNPLTGGRLVTFLTSKGAFAIADKLRKDELFDHYGATRYEQVALRDIAKAKAEGKEPDIKEISKHSKLVESKIREFVRRDVCLPTQVSLQELNDNTDNTQFEESSHCALGGFDIENLSVNPNFDDVMVTDEFRGKVDYALRNFLTNEQRMIFLMKNGDEACSVRIISEKLGLTSHEVNKQYKEAVDRLLMAFQYVYHSDASDYEVG